MSAVDVLAELRGLATTGSPVAAEVYAAVGELIAAASEELEANIEAGVKCKRLHAALARVGGAK